MPDFSYTTRSSDGHIEQGILEANDRRHALQVLNRRGLQPVSLEVIIPKVNNHWSRLKDKITNHLSKGIYTGRLSVKQKLGGIRASLYQQGYIKHESVIDDSWLFDVVIGNFELNQLLEQDGVDLVSQQNQEELSNNLVG